MPDENYQLDLSQLPPDFLRSSRGVAFKIETHEGRENCKIPYSARTKKRASSTDPADWCPLQEALDAVTADPSFAGIGLVIGPPFVGVDIDKVIDDAGVVAPWAQELIASLPPTYTEYSPSGRGFHLWFKSKAPKGDKEGFRAPDLEVYFSKRYFTLTTKRLEGTPQELATLNDEQLRHLLSVVEARKGKKKKSELTTNHRQSAKLKLLMEGKYEEAGFGDVSAAVQSLLTLLAIEHLLDRDKVEAAFKASGLYKDFRPLRNSNWVEKWDRLGKDELDKAIVQAREVLEKIRTHTKEKPNYTARTKKVNLSTVKAAELAWLWPRRVPRGNVTMFAGDPGIGKSLLAIDLVGRGSRGLPFLDGQPCDEPFKSLLLMTEDDRETIIVPRLKVLDADLSMVDAIDMVEVIDEEGEVVRDQMISLDNDVQLLRAEVESDPAIKLLIVDPISNYMGSKSMFKDQDFRAVMMPLVKLAQDTGVSIITIMHNSKQTGRSALQKVGIALGGVGAARIGWTFLQKDEEVRQMLIMKKNLGNFPGIEFTTETAPLEIDGKKTEQARMKFLCETKVSAENALANSEDAKGRASMLAEQLIRKMIPHGKEVRSNEIFKEGEKTAISSDSLQRARSVLGLNTHKKRDGWYWSWPESMSSPTKDDGPSQMQMEVQEELC